MSETCYLRINRDRVIEENPLAKVDFPPEGGRRGGKKADHMCLLSRLPRRKWTRLQTSLFWVSYSNPPSMHLATEKDKPCKPWSVGIALLFCFRGWVCTDLYTCLGPDQWCTLSEAIIVNTSGPGRRLLCACKWHDLLTQLKDIRYHKPKGAGILFWFIDRRPHHSAASYKPAGMVFTKVIHSGHTFGALLLCSLLPPGSVLGDYRKCSGASHPSERYGSWTVWILLVGMFLGCFYIFLY